MQWKASDGESAERRFDSSLRLQKLAATGSGRGQTSLSTVLVGPRVCAAPRSQNAAGRIFRRLYEAAWSTKN